jgi:hypothetical protein
MVYIEEIWNRDYVQKTSQDVEARIPEKYSMDVDIYSVQYTTPLLPYQHMVRLRLFPAPMPKDPVPSLMPYLDAMQAGT